jgi:hypothetical protein
VYGKFQYSLVPHKDVAAVRPAHDILVRGSIETDPLCFKAGSGVELGVAWGVEGRRVGYRQGSGSGHFCDHYS